MFTSRPTGPAQLQLFGIPVRVEPMFFVVIPLLGYPLIERPLLLLTWVVVVFVSILLHELGHAAAYVAFGKRPSIMIYGFGGLTFGSHLPRRWQTIVTSLAGPLVPLFTIGLPAIALADSDWVQARPDLHLVVDMLVWVNAWWGVANLVPLLPLDGGHIVEQLVGTRVARVVTIAVGVPLAIAAYGAGFPFAAVLAAICVLQAFSHLKAAERQAASGSGRGLGPPVGTTAGRPRRRPAEGEGGEFSGEGAVPAAGSGAVAPARPADIARLKAAAADDPGNSWWSAAVDIAEGRTVAALHWLEVAALAGPPPPAVVALVGDESLAPRLAERLLVRAGPRPVVAVAEVAGGLLSSGRVGPAALVLERLALDRRDPPLAEWAALRAAEAWSALGAHERAARWQAHVSGP